MSETSHARSGRPMSAGSPLRTAVLVLLAYAALGAVAGVVWQWIWAPPGQVVQQHQLFYDGYASLRRVYTGTGLYVLVGAAASALVALGACVLARGRELLVLLLVVVGSAVGAAVMWQVGTLLAPGDAPSVAAHAATGTHVIGQLKVAGKSPYLAWPMASLLVLALVYFAWPGSFVQPRHADPTATEHDAEAGPAVPGGGRHQLSELPPDRRRLVDEIRSARFKPTRIRQGYAMGAVDALLDGAADTLSRGESLGAALDAPLPTVTWREGYDRAEVGAFLARLRDSADATDARG